MRGCGKPLRSRRNAGPILPYWRETYVAGTEPRLVPLFDRSFEGVEVIAPDDLDDDGSYDKTATVHNLDAIFCRDAEAIEKATTPLVPDPVLVRSFRET